MTTIKTCPGKILALTVVTLSLGVLLFASVPKAEADPWWYPVSMRTSQYSKNRHVLALPIDAASGVAAAPGIPWVPAMAGASGVAAVPGVPRMPDGLSGVVTAPGVPRMPDGLSGVVTAPGVPRMPDGLSGVAAASRIHRMSATGWVPEMAGDGAASAVVAP